MSLIIVAIDQACDEMIVISDKRETKFEGKKGDVKFSFANDNCIKHHIINDRICFKPGSYSTATEDQPAMRLATMLQFANRPSSDLIKLVAAMDRSYIDYNGIRTHDYVILCGLDDNDKFFIWNGQPDGTYTFQKESLGRFKISISTNGEHLQEPAVSYLASQLKKGLTLLEGLKKTIKFVSSIEKTVSPTYNFSIIKKHKWQQVVK